MTVRTDHSDERSIHVSVFHGRHSFTLGTHTQRGLWYLVVRFLMCLVVRAKEVDVVDEREPLYR